MPLVTPLVPGDASVLPIPKGLVWRAQEQVIGGDGRMLPRGVSNPSQKPKYFLSAGDEGVNQETRSGLIEPLEIQQTTRYLLAHLHQLFLCDLARRHSTWEDFKGLRIPRLGVGAGGVSH